METFWTVSEYSVRFSPWAQGMGMDVCERRNILVFTGELFLPQAITGTDATVVGFNTMYLL